MNFEAPSLVVCQMQMKNVHLVHRHDVENTKDEMLVEEVACNIDHHGAV